MADVTITTISLDSGSNYVVTGKLYGEAVGLGDWVYLKSTDNAWWLADCLATGTAVVAGQALVAGATGDYGVIAIPGAKVDYGSGLVVGAYILSEAGGMAPVVDLAALDYISILGVAESTSVFAINVFNSGIIK